MENNSFRIPNRIDLIQIFRFLLAVFIAFSHFSIVSSFKITSTIVSFCLNFFFALSGFIVMVSTDKKNKKNGFFLRRLIRLVPLYWMLTIVTFVAAQFIDGLLGYTPSIEQLLKSLFFIPFQRAALKAEGTIRPIVGLGHTLQMEVLFSLIFAICMKISHKYRGLITSGILVLLSILGNIVSFNSTILKFYINVNRWSLLSFAVGIGCYYVLKLIQIKKVKNKPVLIFSGSGMIISTLIWSAMLAFSPGMNTRICWYLIFFAIFVFSAAYSSSGCSSPKLLVKLGDASFSFYLIHYFIVSVVERILHITSFNFLNCIIMIVVIIVCWVISYISYLIVEKKLCKWLVNKYNTYLEKKA